MPNYRMSASALLNTVTGQILDQYLPALPIAVGSIGTPIFFQPPTPAPVPILTGTFNCPESGNYFIQLYMRISSDGNVGTSPSTYGYTTSDGFGDNSVTPATLSLPGGLALPFVFTTIGFIGAGVQTFEFTPGTGLDVGTNGEIALRIVRRLA